MKRLNIPQDLGEWKQKHSQIEETGNFLAATCKPEVSKEIRDKIEALNTRWENLFQVFGFMMI